MEKNSQQPRQRQRRQTTVNLEYMLSAVSFPSIQEAKFRFISTVNEEDNVVMKVEKIQAPQRWQLTVKDLTEFGPGGFPRDAVMTALKNAIQQLCEHDADVGDVVGVVSGLSSLSSSDGKSTSCESVPQQNQVPFVDAEMGDDGSLTLFLTIPIVGFPVEFVFPLSLMTRERIDVLETFLHEAREEINKLSNQVVCLQKQGHELQDRQKCSVLVLRTTQSVSTGVISWNTTELNTLGAELTSNNQVVTISQGGLYQIHIRVTVGDSNKNHFINLLVNDVVIAQSFGFIAPVAPVAPVFGAAPAFGPAPAAATAFGPAPAAAPAAFGAAPASLLSGSHCSLNLTELKSLTAGDRLHVACKSNSNMDAQLIYTHFSIMYLGQLGK